MTCIITPQGILQTLLASLLCNEKNTQLVPVKVSSLYSDNSVCFNLENITTVHLTGQFPHARIKVLP